MYLSRYLKVNEKVRFKQVKLWKIKHNQKVNNYYLLCTSSKNLFEIIPGSELNERYKECYLLAISEDKEWIIERVVELVDQLYNQKNIDYAMLKVQ